MGTAWPSPTRRAELAHDRADELRRRHAELAGGIRVTTDVVALARHRAEQAVERAAEAWRASLYRHLESQQAHLRAAAAHEQAAMTAGDDECDRHQSAAEHHRTAAAFHERAFGQLSAAAPPGVTSVEILR